VLEVCPTCTDTSAQMAAPLADRGINDRLVELRSLVDETCFEFIDVHLLSMHVEIISVPAFAQWARISNSCRQFEKETIR